MNTRAWLLLAVTTSLSTVAHAGQGVWTSHGPYGGDITALAVDPLHPATLYAGTGDGRGVFKSTDSGLTWVATGPPNVYVGTLAISPSNPSTLYAAGGNGVFTSTDSGASWSGSSTSAYVTSLAVDPTTPTTLYVGTQLFGVFKSTDGGGSWTAMNGHFATGLTSSNVVALAVDPSTPTTLYVSTAGEGGGVSKSTDGGESWTAINTGLVKTSMTNVTVNVLVIDRSTPATLYAGTDSGAFKSTNGGESWTAINTGLANAYHPGGVSALVIDPSAPTTLYANGYGIFKSTDGGASWQPAITGLTDTSVQALAIDPSAPASLYAGTFTGGVFKSTNGGERWAATSTGLNFSVSAVAVDPSAPTTLYVGTYPNGSVSKSTDGGSSWKTILAIYSRLEALAVDPSAPDTLYAGSSSDFFYEYPGLYQSTDFGANWTQTLGASIEVYALAIDPQAPGTIYAGTGDYRGYGGGVFKSTDHGGSWSAVNAGLPGSDVKALVIDPSAPATLYAGIYNGGGFFKSTDGAGSWSAIDRGLTATSIYAMAIDPSRPATLYAGTEIGIFKSTDGGATWLAANTGLTNLVVNALGISPTTPSTLYAGTNGGVFRSTDSGGMWAAFNAGLPNSPVNALALDPAGTSVYAGLEGGGVWQLTSPTTITVTALLPASAHAKGANGAFYTTDLSVANTGDTPASFALKFLGHDQDGSGGAEQIFNLGPGTSTTFSDVLGSVFGQTNNFGAIRITSNTPSLDVVSVTSTPGFGGTFGQEIPAVAFTDLIPTGSSRSILYIREGDGFRTNLILASGSSVSTDVDVALVLPASPWDYAWLRRTLATKTYTVPPNGMIQVNRVVRDMGISGPVTGARLVLSSSTAGSLFTGLASIIDERTNDPTVVLAQPASVSGSAPYSWLLPSGVHSSGINGAFYTTNLAVANVGAAPASFTMKFLGHDQDGSGGPEQTFDLGAGDTVTYFDVLGSVFHQTSNFGAIRITPRVVGRLGGASSGPSNVVSVTSTSGLGGTLSQTVPAVSSTDLIPAGSQRSILHICEGDGFRSESRPCERRRRLDGRGRRSSCLRRGRLSPRRATPCLRTG